MEQKKENYLKYWSQFFFYITRFIKILPKGENCCKKFFVFFGTRDSCTFWSFTNFILISNWNKKQDMYQHYEIQWLSCHEFSAIYIADFTNTKEANWAKWYPSCRCLGWELKKKQKKKPHDFLVLSSEKLKKISICSNVLEMWKAK